MVLWLPSYTSTRNEYLYWLRSQRTMAAQLAALVVSEPIGTPVVTVDKPYSWHWLHRHHASMLRKFCHHALKVLVVAILRSACQTMEEK